MPALFAADALLPSGWARDVLIEWDDAGTLTAVTPGAAPGEAERARGSVLPGMTDVHSHSFQRAMAGLAELRGHPTDDFWTWREEMYRLVARLDPDDIEAISTHLYVEMLRHGYTAVAEFHYMHRDRDGSAYADRAEMANRVVNASQSAGIAMTLLPVLYAHGGFGHKILSPAQNRFASDARFVLDLLGELRDFHSPHRLLRFGVAPHSVRAVDAGQLTELVDGARAFGAEVPIHMHISEQLGEVNECIETQGVTPLDWVCDLVAVDARWCFIHATHLTQLEMRRLMPTGATIGLCPATEANLGDGIFEFAPWFEARSPWAIGGDSHVSVSPFEQLRALEYSQRLRHRERNIAATMEEPDVASNLWRAAAAGGARAAAQPAGEIAAGRRADLVVIDDSALEFESLAAPARLGVAIFGGNRSRVRDVYVAGEPVVREGRHVWEEDAIRRYRLTLRKLRAAQ